MNEEQQLIIDTANRIFKDQCDKSVVDAAEAGEFPLTLWNTLEETGLTTMGVEAEQGGSGGTFTDALLVLRAAGSSAAPLPLAEHLIALQLLARADTDVPKGIMTIAAVNNGQVGDVRFSEAADWVLFVDQNSVALAESGSVDWQRVTGMAGESKASLTSLPQLDQIDLSDAAELLTLLGARARVNLMSGAMAEVLAMSVQYVSEREQFGRSLSKFQAIQHQLALLAGDVAACQRAADATLESENPLDVAIAKTRLGEAVTQITDIAHQVHGAIGYTLEHALNHRTRRLWQWRDEYGTERYWQLRLGRHFCAQGADNLWNSVTSLS